MAHDGGPLSGDQLPPEHPQPKTHHQFLGLALIELLIDQGLLTAGELKGFTDRIDSVGVATHGARVVAKAWKSPDFHDALMHDGADAVTSLGLDPGCSELVALQNTPRLHNIVVSSLCASYPRTLLGRPPSWYTCTAYRARVVKEPRKVLAEFGTQLPDGVEVRVHDCVADLRYIVLPRRPAGTDDWSESQLARLVTAKSMVGVSPALSPETVAKS